MAENPLDILRKDSDLTEHDIPDTDYQIEGALFSIPEVKTVPVDVYYRMLTGKKISIESGVERLPNTPSSNRAVIIFGLKDQTKRIYSLDSPSFKDFKLSSYEDFPEPKPEDIIWIEFLSWEWSLRYTDILKGLERIRNLSVPPELENIPGISDIYNPEDLIPEGWDDPNSEFWTKDPEEFEELTDKEKRKIRRDARRVAKANMYRVGSRIAARAVIIRWLKIRYPNSRFRKYQRTVVNEIVEHGVLGGGLYDDPYPVDSVGAVNEGSSGPSILDPYDVETGKDAYTVGGDDTQDPDYSGEVMPRKIEGTVTAMTMGLYKEYQDYNEYAQTYEDNGGDKVLQFFNKAEVVLDAAEEILTGIEQLIDVIPEILEDIAAFPEKIAEALENVGGFLEDLFDGGLLDMLSDLPGMLLDFLLNLPILRDFFSLLARIHTLVTAIITTIAQLRLPTSLRTAIKLIRRLKTILSLAKSLYTTAMEFKNLGEALKNLPETIADQAVGMVTGIAREAVGNVIGAGMGAVAPIVSAVDRVTGKVNNVSQTFGGGAILPSASDKLSEMTSGALEQLPEFVRG